MGVQDTIIGLPGRHGERAPLTWVIVDSDVGAARHHNSVTIFALVDTDDTRRHNQPCPIAEIVRGWPAFVPNETDNQRHDKQQEYERNSPLAPEIPQFAEHSSLLASRFRIEPIA